MKRSEVMELLVRKRTRFQSGGVVDSSSGSRFLSHCQSADRPAARAQRTYHLPALQRHPTGGSDRKARRGVPSHRVARATMCPRVELRAPTSAARRVRVTPTARPTGVRWTPVARHRHPQAQRRDDYWTHHTFCVAPVRNAFLAARCALRKQYCCAAVL